MPGLPSPRRVWLTRRQKGRNPGERSSPVSLARVARPWTRSAMSEAAVLLVDDDAPIRRMLERSLSAEGYDVCAVADGGLALAQVERSLPDVIVLDIAMPGMDGLAVTR